MKYIHLSEIDSTNEYLKNNYQDLENYTFVSSDNQLKGRGRNNRLWKSENGKNLLFSLLILDKSLISRFKEISIVTAVSISEVLEELNIKNVSIKWPNDIYVNDKKISGVLLEAISKSELECLIVGCGINVNQKIFDGEYLKEPTSIINELNNEQNIDTIKKLIYSKIIENLEKIKNNHNFYPYIYSHDYLKDKQAYATINNKVTQVDIKGINEDYSIKLKHNNQIINVDSGEISFHI